MWEYLFIWPGTGVIAARGGDGACVDHCNNCDVLRRCLECKDGYFWTTDYNCVESCRVSEHHCCQKNTLCYPYVVISHSCPSTGRTCKSESSTEGKVGSSWQFCHNCITNWFHFQWFTWQEMILGAKLYVHLVDSGHFGLILIDKYLNTNFTQHSVSQTHQAVDFYVKVHFTYILFVQCQPNDEFWDCGL